MSLPDDDYDCAEEILQKALVRLKRERDDQRGLLEDLLEQVRTCDLMLAEAEEGVAALEHLLSGALYIQSDRINARWDAMTTKFIEAGKLPNLSAEPPADPVIAQAPVEPAPAVVPEPVEIQPEAQPAAAPPPQVDGYSAFQTASMQRVMGALFDLADGADRISVPFSRLSKAASVPEGSISFLVYALEARGLLTVVKGVDRKPNTYVLLSPPPAVAAEAPQGLAEPSPAPEPPSTEAEPPAAGAEAAFALDDEEPWPESDGDDAPGPKTLLNLRRNECHYPIGDDRPQRYCGSVAVIGTEYCACHTAAMYVPSKVRESARAHA